MNRHIFLYGPSGSGKSTIGKALAARLGLPFFDLDGEIENRQGRTIPEIFQTDGEQGFRQLEKAALFQLPAQGHIVALGGGALLDVDSRRYAEENGLVLFLNAPLQVLVERLTNSSEYRPLIGTDLPGRLGRLLEERAEHYNSFNKRFDTTQANQDGIVGELTRICQIHAGNFMVDRIKRYPVRVEPGSLKATGGILQAMKPIDQIALVSDQTVGVLYANQVCDTLAEAGFQVFPILIPAGEAAKNIRTVEMIWEEMLQHGLSRAGLVLALGGGVVSDLAGFAAATFLRGVRWGVLPTTLLAMADASLGGKTGIDLTSGKNLAGAFHPPVMVVADTDTLHTLPEAEWRNGMAEIVKHGVIADPQLFRQCLVHASEIWSMDPSSLLEIIRRAVAVKIEIIEKDPYEQGPREALNFGHTLGHAVEHASQYRIRHGEAVAIGMVLETRLAEEIGLAKAGLAQQIEDVLIKLGLPTQIPDGLDPQDIIRAVEHDKKNRHGKVRFAIPADIGDVRTGIEIDDLWRKYASGSGTARS